MPAPRTSPNYLAGYPVHWVEPVRSLIQQGQFAHRWLQKYPAAHAVRTDKSLYAYVQQLKSAFLRNAPPINKVVFDGSLPLIHQALGLHTRSSRVQGGQLKAKREIRVASLFKDMPAGFLRMIVAHELAHLKEREHNKAFYQLCRNIEPAYAQLEFDLRCYLSYLDTGGVALWMPLPADAVDFST